MSFERYNFDPWVADAVAEAGYVQPTPIQERAIGPVMEGHDVLGLAQTGTGKTAAFLLPIIERLLDGELGEVRALVVAPTRELAEQINDEFKMLARHTDLRSCTVYGGVGKHPQIKALNAGVELVVACPGRLLDHYQAGDIDFGFVEVLVLDEADHMFDMGFIPDIRRILKLLPAKRQNLFFSATMPWDIRTLADGVLDDPVVIEIDAHAPASTVSHALYPVTEALRKPVLRELLRRTPPDRVLIFARTKQRARELAESLKREGHSVASLQGDMTQIRRQRAIDGFRKGRYAILVATDVAARGIDISDVSRVINYDMPGSVDAYTHRIGRTGRALQTGEALTLTTWNDEDLVERVEKVLGEPIERKGLDDFDYGSFDPVKRPGRAKAGVGYGIRASRRGGGGSFRGKRISRRG